MVDLVVLAVAVWVPPGPGRAAVSVGQPVDWRLVHRGSCDHARHYQS